MASKENCCEILPSPKSDMSKGETNDIYWQSTLEKPTDRLTALYEHSRLTDLIISFPGHSTKLKVHRLILAMSSPVFERMLFGPMAEGDELKHLDDPPEAFEWLMQYIYSGASVFPSVHIAVQVLHLASKYQMQALFVLCSQFLQTNVNGSNLPLVYDTASLLGDAGLQKVCSAVFNASAEKVLLSNDIGQLSDESMKHLLQQELNISSEVSVFKGLVKWGTTQLHQSSDTSESSCSIRQKIEEFLPYVRFLTMGLDEFVEYVLTCNIFTPEEGIAIMMNIKNVKNVPLPDMCSKVTKKRLAFELTNIHRVTLSNQANSYRHRCYPINDRQKIITNLNVSQDIYLGNITLRTNSNSYFKNWHIEVAEDSGDILGEVKFGESDQFNSTQITATFNTPVLLRSNTLYDIWVRDAPQVNYTSGISNQYRNLSFSGNSHLACYAEIGFWCSEISV